MAKYGTPWPAYMHPVHAVAGLRHTSIFVWIADTMVEHPLPSMERRPYRFRYGICISVASNIHALHVHAATACTSDSGLVHCVHTFN